MSDKKIPRLIPLVKWNQFHEYPPLGGLRHLVFTMPEGFEKVVKKVNNRVLIDEDAWFEWVDKKNSVEDEDIETLHQEIDYKDRQHSLENIYEIACSFKTKDVQVKEMLEEIKSWCAEFIV